jgi:tetratricopeptide (TPR) repeat protein
MARRSGWLCIWLVSLGCHSLPLADDEHAALAGRLWEQGQTAMSSGQFEDAIRLYEQSLVVDPTLSRSHLSLAAAYLEKNESDRASSHLGEYIQAHPEQLEVRSRYAELQLRLGRVREARQLFDSLIADGQEQGDRASDSLVTCHGRLAELAEQAHDDYGAHLNRGIGLFRLAGARSTLPDPDGELPAESLLCKAAAELTLAHVDYPDRARPCWYLYRVWRQLGQRQPALCRLRQAEAAAPFSFLTPAEQRGLELAAASLRAESRGGG